MSGLTAIFAMIGVQHISSNFATDKMSLLFAVLLSVLFLPALFAPVLIMLDLMSDYDYVGKHLNLYEWTGAALIFTGALLIAFR